MEPRELMVQFDPPIGLPKQVPSGAKRKLSGAASASRTKPSEQRETCQ